MIYIVDEEAANIESVDTNKLTDMPKEEVDALVSGVPDLIDTRWISRYRMARAEHGWSQARVAAKLMVSRGKITRFENGQIKALTPAEVITLAYILGIEPGDNPYVANVADLKVEHRSDGTIVIENADGRWWSLAPHIER